MFFGMQLAQTLLYVYSMHRYRIQGFFMSLNFHELFWIRENNPVYGIQLIALDVCSIREFWDLLMYWYIHNNFYVNYL